MLACLLAVAGLVVGPPARLGLAPTVRMCDSAPPAPSSLLKKLTDDRMAAMSYWDEMAEAFAGAAGVPYVVPDSMGEKKEWETAEIDIEQFTALLASKGDGDLGEAKVAEMFTSVPRLIPASLFVPRLACSPGGRQTALRRSTQTEMGRSSLSSTSRL